MVEHRTRQTKNMNIRSEKFIHKLNKKNNVIIECSKKVFKPTGTSIELLNSCNKEIKAPGNLLDVGCGSGFVAIALKKMNKNINNVYASDISLEATKLAHKNAENNNVKIITKCGNVFQPWKRDKFDYIINDVSGISEKLSRASTWFEGISCKSGADGTKLVTEALKNSRKNLKKNGKFFFPILSFSNTEKILICAKKSYKNIKLISHKEWVMPKELRKHRNLLDLLREKKYISFKEKFGMLIWYTNIYVAFN